MQGKLALGIFFGWLLIAAGVARAAEAPPLELYGRLPSLEDLALSPDGSRIAFVRTEGDERIIYIVSLTEHKTLRGIRVGASKLRQLLWGDNDYLMVITSSSQMPMDVRGARTEFSLLQTINVTNGNSVNPMNVSSQDTILNTIMGPPMLRKIDGATWVYVVGYATQDRRFLPALFKFQLGRGTAKIVARGDAQSRGWLVDKDGVVIATNGYDEGAQRWTVGLRIDGHMKDIASGTAAIERPQLVGFAPEGDALWLEVVDHDDPVWKSVALKDGTIGDIVDKSQGFEDLIEERYTGRIIGGRLTNSTHDLEFFDNRLRETWRVLKSRFPRERVSVVSLSADFKTWAVHIEGVQHGNIYGLFDEDSYQFQSIGPAYEGLNRLAEVRRITYAASDGLEIPAILTLPDYSGSKRLPLVVLPHGGPAARDTGSFDWLAQALATRGYVVLQPNFRGSDLGWEFMSAGFGEWGRKMQTDLSDGVRMLAKQGLIDPARVCIVGASYGGYAALAGASLDLGVYRCAVSVGGISDLRQFKNWITEKHRAESSAESRYFDRYLGAAGKNDEILKSRSPLQQIDKITIPILLIHGRDDSVVPFEQSDRMADALRRAQKPVEFILLKKEDHWLSRSETRLQTLQATVQFLLAHNPPD